MEREKLICCQNAVYNIVYNLLLKFVLVLLYILPAVTSYQRQVVYKIGLNQHLENTITEQDNSPKTLCNI